MCPNLEPFIRGSRSHSSQSWLRCPDSVLPPSTPLTRSGCLNPGIRINPTVPPCAPELRDFFFTYLEISLVKPCGFLWWARFLRFDLGLAVPAWSLIGRHRAHMSTLIRYSMQEKISKYNDRSHCDVKAYMSWSWSKEKFVTICQVASAPSNYARPGAEVRVTQPIALNWITDQN